MNLARLHARVVSRSVSHALREDRWIVLAALVVAVGAAAIARFPHRSEVGLAGICALGLMQAASFTRHRADRDWMRIMGKDSRTLLVAQAALAAAPFALLALTTGAPLAPLTFAATLVVGACAGFLPAAGIARDRVRARRFIPFVRAAPEWTAGVRSSPSVLIFWLALSIATGWRHWIVVIAFITAGMYAAQFFALCEPRAWLQATRLSAGRLLARKLGVAALVFVALAVAPMISITVSAAQFATATATATATASASALGLVALAAFGGWLVVAMSLLGKYAFYDEGADRSRLVGLISALTLLTFFFPPMTFIGLALLWRRARRRLHEVLACSS